MLFVDIIPAPDTQVWLSLITAGVSIAAMVAAVVTQWIVSRDKRVADEKKVADKKTADKKKRKPAVSKIQILKPPDDTQEKRAFK